MFSAEAQSLASLRHTNFNFRKFHFSHHNCTEDTKKNNFFLFSMEVKEKELKLQHIGAFTLQMLEVSLLL